MKNKIPPKPLKPSRGQEFAESVLSGKESKELIAWAEREIEEYKKFIEIIKKRSKISSST